MRTATKVGIGLAGTAIVYAVVNKINNKILIAKIDKILDGKGSARDEQKEEKRRIDIAKKGFGATTDDAFNPTFWLFAKKEGKANIRLKEEAIKNYSSKIYWALFGVPNNFDKIKAVFNGLKSKVDVSQIADYYAKDNDIGLYHNLKTDLMNNEVTEIERIVAKLPTFRK